MHPDSSSCFSHLLPGEHELGISLEYRISTVVRCNNVIVKMEINVRGSDVAAGLEC